MRKAFLTLIALVPFLCGCQATLGNFGGWAIWSATASSWTIVNNTSDCRFLVLLNGRVKNQYYVQPGSSFSLEIRNFSDISKEYTIIVQAEDCNGNMVGVATRSFSLGRYQASAESWVINTSDLQMRR